MLKKKKIRVAPFDILLYLLMLAVVLLILLPMVHMIAVSFSSDVYVMKGQVGLWPRGFTVKTFGYVFEDTRIFRSYGKPKQSDYHVKFSKIFAHFLARHGLLLSVCQLQSVYHPC